MANLRSMTVMEKKHFQMFIQRFLKRQRIVFDGHPYLALEKNGRSYIYDVDNDMKEIYSIEKEIVLHDEGYFTIGDQYYTLTGQKIK